MHFKLCLTSALALATGVPVSAGIISERADGRMLVNAACLGALSGLADEPKICRTIRRGMTKLLFHGTVEKTWGAIHTPLHAAPESVGTGMGLSEITLHGDDLHLIERYNGNAAKARTKALKGVRLAAGW